MTLSSALERPESSLASPPEPVEAPLATRHDRVLGRLVGDSPGPTLVVIGGVHGNEPSGVRALERVFAVLERRTDAVVGELLALAGNLEALDRGVRFLDRDLNRSWTPERVEHLRHTDGGGPAPAEDAEQRALIREIDAAVGRARGPVFVLDLHSTSAGGAPFVVLEDTLRNRAFASTLPAPIVLGLEEELSGTVLAFFSEEGFTTIAFESGQHDSPDSIDHAEAVVWRAVEAAGLLVPGRVEPPSEPVEKLAEISAGLPDLAEVRYRHAIEPEDGFHMRPGYSNFQPVKQGEVLADDIRGPVRSPMSGLILMPLYQKLGEDGFFIVRGFRPFWMKVSAGLRRAGADRFAHLLPGVSRHSERPATLLINPGVARFFPREIFHLLGYKRTGMEDGRLVFTRRVEE